MTEDFASVSIMSDSIETMMARSLARRIIIRHLHISLVNKVELRVFESFHCSKFQEYLARMSVLPFEEYH